jgi:hypothetical protein
MSMKLLNPPGNLSGHERSGALAHLGCGALLVLKNPGEPADHASTPFDRFRMLATQSSRTVHRHCPAGVILLLQDFRHLLMLVELVWFIRIVGVEQ